MLNGPVIFDRAVPDVIGYLRLSGLSVPVHAERAAHMFRYHSCVFIAPPWPEIFKQDVERKQSLEDAEATYKAMAETYSNFGYELLPLPRSSVEDRVRFVTDYIESTR